MSFFIYEVIIAILVFVITTIEYNRKDHTLLNVLNKIGFSLSLIYYISGILAGTKPVPDGDGTNIGILVLFFPIVIYILLGVLGYLWSKIFTR